MEFRSISPNELGPGDAAFGDFDCPADETAALQQRIAVNKHEVWQLIAWLNNVKTRLP
jgi:hypothetical protein